MAKKRTEATIEEIRHSLAHLLAAAVLKKFPNAKLGIGPVIENGFYYDFLLPRTLTPDDLKEFEAEMKFLVRQKLSFGGKKVTPIQAKKLFKNQPFKLDLVNEFTKDKKPLSIYHTYSQTKNAIASYIPCLMSHVACFTDLCRGGHVKNTKKINPEAFKLEKIAGAYWRGDEKKPQLQRIYGLAFETKKELNDYLVMLAEAEKRDHRKLGKELKLFAFSDYVGPGLPLWLPKGTVIVETLERLAKETERQAGYQQVRTPHIAKEIMYKTSGHLPYYAKSMFPPMVLKEEDGREEKYYLKAMNCPHHHQIYAAEPRSYRDLPLRLSEYGTVYRYEKSGELFGLMRVRMLNMNDAHIYCTEEQFEAEFNAVNDMYLKYFKLFGLNKYVMRFSTHDSKELGKKYVNEPKLWKKTEDMVRKVLVKSKINFVEVSNEAAFYGPKIDVQVWSSIGREFTLATNQVDFAVPKRFGLTYTDRGGKEKTPLVIHRAPLGTHERFIGFLIEHFAGAFPFWLAPVQIKIVPVADRHVDYARKVADQLKSYRVEIAEEKETVSKKIRTAELQKIPYIIVVGDDEQKNNTIRLRERRKGDVGELTIAEFLKKIPGQ